jgi:hypothetical protein
MPVWAHGELERCWYNVYPVDHADDLKELERIADPMLY